MGGAIKLVYIYNYFQYQISHLFLNKALFEISRLFKLKIEAALKD